MMVSRLIVRGIRGLHALLLVAAVCGASLLQAGDAHYSYDELGRLSTVVDGTGATAIYSYDAVGNLTGIERFTPPGGSGAIGIYTLIPNKGAVGASVKIQGYGFDPTPGNNTVTFNGTAATVSSATAYALVVTVPTGATTGTVSVTNSNGTANSPQPFTVLGAPTISGLSPSTVAQGTIWPLTISGTGLEQATAVTFTQAGITATIQTGVTGTAVPIKLQVASTVPAGTYAFTVSTPLGTANSGTVVVTVAAPTQVFVHTPTHVSVWLVPAPGTPSGPSMAVTPTSEFFTAGSMAPTGATMSVQPASEFLPAASMAPTVDRPPSRGGWNRNGGFS